MKFKNDRPTLIHLPDDRITKPDEEFSFDSDQVKHQANIELMRARFITPQDDEARAYVTQIENKEKAATARRLAEIDASPEFSEAAKKKARKNAESTETAKAEYDKQPTGLEEARAAGQPVAGEPGHPQTTPADLAEVVVPPAPKKSGRPPKVSVPPPPEAPAPAADPKAAKLAAVAAADGESLLKLSENESDPEVISAIGARAAALVADAAPKQ